MRRRYEEEDDSRRQRYSPSETSSYQTYSEGSIKSRTSGHGEHAARADDSTTSAAVPLTGFAKCMSDVKSDCGHLKVLMWKHMIVRKRKFIKTILELISPCFFLIIFYYCKGLLQGLTSPAPEDNSPLSLGRQNEFSGPLALETVLAPRVVLYNPVNRFTDQLMDLVGDKLDLERTYSMPVDGDSLVYYGFSNGFKQLVNYLAKATAGIAIVEFKGLNNNAWPKKLNYSIKMKHKEDLVGGNKKVGDYTPFMRVQWAIDSSFIEIITKNSSEKTARSSTYLPPVSLSEIPTQTGPPGVSKNARLITLICDMVIIEIISFSMLLPFMFLYTRLMGERGSGIQELLCQTGVSYSVLVNSHGCNTILTGVVFATCGTLVFKLDPPFFPTSNGLLLFLALQLYFHSFITWAFLFTFINKSGEYAGISGIIFYFLLIVLSNLVKTTKIPLGSVRMISGLLPNMPIYHILQEIKVLEITERGLSFSDLMKSHTDTGTAAALGYLAMCIQIALLLLVCKYLNDVRPGKYGTSKPCSSIFKRKEHVASTALEEIEEEKLKRDPMLFEDTKLSNVGVRIENVSKIFDKFVALTNVSFNAYKGEITVLLGHNGAGKTTILSIIAGTLSLTKGRVFVHGYDITHEKSKVQSKIGTCPQHNIFFPDLTVSEHVRLFAMLRGTSCREAKISTKELLERLILSEKGNYKADKLSGGMKRRLQLACALAGDCSVLILDEPTSGLDVETRRELWNLLLTLRGSRTVLLTTHFMEEADALGDRVAALHAGRLRCHATPMYLKKNIGTGYRLTLNTFDNIPKEREITSAIQRVVPNATLKETSLHSISYNLPSQDCEKFSSMFTELENEKEELGIESIGVGATSLEEVFLKLCSDTTTTFTDENVDTKLSEPNYSRIKGSSLTMRHIKVLAKRQMRFIWSKKLGFLIMQIILPILIWVVLAYTILVDKPDEDEKKKFSEPAMSVDFNDRGDVGLLLRAAPVVKPGAVRLAKHYTNVKFQFTDSVTDKLFRASDFHRNSTAYNLGIDVQDDFAKGTLSRRSRSLSLIVVVTQNHVRGLIVLLLGGLITLTPGFIGLIDSIPTRQKKKNNAILFHIVFYTSEFRSVAPVVLNLLSNILAAHHRPGHDGRTITTLYEPIDEDETPPEMPEINLPINSIKCGFFTFMWLIVFTAIVVNAVNLPVIERETGTRHIHLMAGVSPLIHWLTTWIFHILLYSILLLLPTLIILLCFANDTFDQAMFQVCFFFAMLLALMAILTMSYLASFFYSSRGVTLLMIFMTVLLGLIPGIFIKVDPSQKNYKIYVKIPINICYYLIPMATASVALLNMMDVARKNMMCNKNLDKCPDLLGVILKMVKETNVDAKKCCSEKKGTMGFLGFGPLQSGKECIVLVAQMLLYFTLVILTQKGIFNGLFDRMFNKTYKVDPTESDDYNIRTEKNYVTEEMELHTTNRMGDAMLVNDVHKKYFKLCGKSVNAVKGLSFSVKRGECFGLLGVNGAGKSTTFKMITAEEVTTRGRMHANGHDLKWPRNSEYLKSLSYCPQFFSLDNFETGQNNLMTLLTMRGLNSVDATHEANTWIETVGLERYRNTLVAGYSGGCERRLATAAALSSGAPLTLLDEPTAGVDVSARRKVWVALRKGLRHNRAVIITSHSMDEMEALCDRIVIMAAGKAVALGSAPALRAAYATGHALSIKISEGDSEDVARLKDTITRSFDCSLVDEHATMLQYHINVQMHYSELFSTLEDIKRNFQPDIIEDYSVSETTLEEVFLSFAKK